MSTVSRYRPVSDWGRSHFRNGELNGEIEALLTVLSARGLDVTDDARARITECTDIEQLTTWIRRAVTADGVEEIFG